ncbi:MAG: hypothetical protein QXH42_09350 [Thermoplasmata archaeon]
MSAARKHERCPGCGAKVRRERLESHIRKVHGRVAPESPRGHPARRRRLDMLAIALVAAAVAGAVALYALSGPGEERGSGGRYTPKHKSGTGPEHFWTVYPSGHVQAGNSVPFPSWVREESASKVLLILVHSEGCAPCIQQQEDVRALMGDGSLSASVSYIDLLADGSDARAQDCFRVFDPDGMQNYIPLTVVVARDPAGTYFWHSWEGVTGRANLEGWLRDAMHYRAAGLE